MMSPNDRRPLGWKPAATLALLLAIAIAVSGVLDRAGSGYTEAGLKRALVTFAVARGLNAVISVAQGTEVAIQPAGVGVNFAPGQVLDPLNDLVERFSWLMLASATSLGVQRVLLELFAVPAANALLAALLLAAALALWRPPAPVVRRALWRLTFTLLILRFAAPLAALANQGLYDAFLQPRYEQSSQAVGRIEKEFDSLQQRERRTRPAADQGLLEQAQAAYHAAKETLDVERQLERYRQAADALSEQLVELIVTFLLQTLLLPLLFLWLVVRALGAVWRHPFPA
ncbi:hypothetical protein [Endothiovibrio diazotrophicus]